MTNKKLIPLTSTEVIRSRILLSIANGELEESGKLPSLRDAAILFNYHRNTVGKAYAKLVDEGRVEARLGSGYYVIPQYDPTTCPLYAAICEMFSYGMTIEDVKLTFSLAVAAVEAQNEA